MKPEHAEVVVIGGGAAGLAAAWALREHEVIVLESADRIGGRIRVGHHDQAPYHLGAQYLAGSVSAAVLDELDVTREPLPHADAVFMNGQVLRGGLSKVMHGAGVGVGGLVDLMRVHNKSATASKLVADILDPAGDLEIRSLKAKRLDRRTLADVLGACRPNVRTLYEILVRSLTSCTPEALSALYALAMLGAEGPNGVGHPARAAGGMRGLLDGFTRNLGSRIRTQSTATGVVSEAHEARVEYHDGQTLRVIRAPLCIVATPAPIAGRICDALPTSTQVALEGVQYARFLSVALFLREPVWDRGWGMATDLPVVSTLLNPAVLTGSGCGEVLSTYASHDAATRVWKLPDAEIIDLFATEIGKVFPRADQLVAGADVRRWDLGYPAWRPGYLELLPSLLALRGPIVLAGDYLSIPSIEGAMVSGLQAARIAQSQLRS